MKLILSFLSTFLFAATVFGGIGTYDFEVNPNPPGGQSMGLPMTGTTAEIQIPGPNNGIQLQNSGAARFGNLSLAFNNYSITFVRGSVNSFSFEIGDSDPDIDSITVNAYSSSFELLTSVTETLTPEQPG